MTLDNRGRPIEAPDSNGTSRSSAVNNTTATTAATTTTAAQGPNQVVVIVGGNGNSSSGSNNSSGSSNSNPNSTSASPGSPSLGHNNMSQNSSGSSESAPNKTPPSPLTQQHYDGDRTTNTTSSSSMSPPSPPRVPGIISATSTPPSPANVTANTSSFTGSNNATVIGNGSGSIGIGGNNDLTCEELIEAFPEAKLRSLTTKISSSRWVVPVLPTQELECLLNYAIRLTEAGCDHECEPCLRFYRESLYISFVKILTDEAVNSWKYNIHFCILNTCGKLLQLCALHMQRDNASLLDLLAIVLDPDNKFNTFNISRLADQFVGAVANAGANSVQQHSASLIAMGTSPNSAAATAAAMVASGGGPWPMSDDRTVYARSPPDPKPSRGWLVDMLNRFGQCGGFDNMLERFHAGIAVLNQEREAAQVAKIGGAAAAASGGTSQSSISLATAAAAATAADLRRKISAGSASLAGTLSGSSGSNVPGESTTKSTLHLIHALLRPFGQCAELLTVTTIEKYFVPIWDVVLGLMDALTDDDLKREAKPEGRSDSINGIVRSARALAGRLGGQDALIRELEMFRLKMVLRLLKVSGFTGKMNALNEINKMLSAVKHLPHRTQIGGAGGNGGSGASQAGSNVGGDDDMDWLTADRMATWIKDTDVLGIVLRDSLHQAQYVEKLERIIRFLIKEKALTLDDLDAVWRAQDGKHETIVKNVHELLAKLAWDFDAEQLDHLFDCFEASMSTANKRQRDRLLELIRRLAEDDKIGVMAHKVLCRFWQLAHSPDIAQDVLDQALGAHVKILDYSCTKDKDTQRALWLDRCVQEVKSPASDGWVLPALRLIREICCLYETTPNHMPRTQTLNRQHVIERLQNEHSLVILVTNSLTAYLDRVREHMRERPAAAATADGKTAALPPTICDNRRYTHTQLIQERLDFLKFVLKDGQLWLCADQARQIWSCLAVDAVFPSDREECFRWFGKLMGDEPDLDPGINRQFFEMNFLQLDPQLMSEAGIKCFERFFKAVNSKEEKLKAKSRGYVLDDEDLIGREYLWRVITTGHEEIAHRAIELLIEVSTALGPRLQSTIVDYHETFIGESCERLRAYYDNVVALTSTIDADVAQQKLHSCQDGAALSAEQQQQAQLRTLQVSRDRRQRYLEADKMCRVLRVLQEYIKECDRHFNGERFNLPLGRAHRGKHITLFIRFQQAGRPMEDVEIQSHANEMVSTLKRNFLRKIKGNSPPLILSTLRVDFCYNSGEPLDIADDRNPIGQYMLRDKTSLTAKLTPIGNAGHTHSPMGGTNSPDSSSDSSTGSPPRPCPDVPRTDSERTLPGVIIAQKPVFAEFFLRLYQQSADLGLGAMRENCTELLHLLPLDRQTVQNLNAMCFQPINTTSTASTAAPDATAAASAATQATAVAPADADADATTASNGNNSSSSSSSDSSPARNAGTAPPETVLAATVPPAATPANAIAANVEQRPLPPRSPKVVPTPESLFLHSAPAQVLYNLEVLHALLKPAIDPFHVNNLQFQSAWVHSGCAHFVLDLLTKNNFLPGADAHTKRAAFQCVLRLAKIFMYIIGCVLGKVADEPDVLAAQSLVTGSPNNAADLAGEHIGGIVAGGRSQIEILKSTLVTIFGNAEQTVRAVSAKLADNVATEMLSEEPEGDVCRRLFASALRWSCPDLHTVKAIVQLCWASSLGRLHELGEDCNGMGQFDKYDTQYTSQTPPEPHDQSICRDALEVLTISLVLNPAANEALSSDPMWSSFVTSLVLRNPVRAIRQQAAEQLYFACTYCAADWRPFGATVRCLVAVLYTLVPQYASTCADYFNLLCRTLSYGCKYQWPLQQDNDALLEQEIAWLRSVKDVVRERGETQVHEDLLEGHLSLTKELMAYLPVALKAQLNEFVVELVDEFLYPASRQYLHLRRRGEFVLRCGPPPVCRTPHTVGAAGDLVVALCQGSIENMTLIVNTILDMFFTDTEPLREWEYLSPVGPRPYRGFSGLKNAGATCYMNSVLQQLFMVPMIRRGILEASGAATDPNEDFSGESDSMLGDVFDESSTSNRNQYHVGILKHVQAIFAHLGHSALQFYVPRGLWTHFKLQGEPVNLREQQDAVEFFMSLFESLDEGLKALGHTQLMGATLGGCFSDQKICQECPHRYAKEEPFSVFSVDIRNHSSLTESLEQYVKGELLEGADAYHCDKCDKKVVTIKRLCVQRLPKVLAIQLKRFEYDYERVCAIKFNDYFEFPRSLNMEPYTVTGLAKLDNKMIELNEDLPADAVTSAAESIILNEEPECTTYQLTGIVVHSGQASGGHYFSYIRHREPTTNTDLWYKFDDGEVTECKMNDDDEMKAQCFGGDYMGEVYDNNLKRMQLRRQKRWWNAYMLFYTRTDQIADGSSAAAHVEQLSLAESRHMCLQMPGPIERSVRAQNLRFLHSRNLFAVEFFNFVRKLVEYRNPAVVSHGEKALPQSEELSLLAVQLASQFLFHSGFRTKKSLRGPAIDWFDGLSLHIRQSADVRRWFAANVLLKPATRLAEYILIAPSQEVRLVFVKFVAVCCIFAGNDPPLPLHEGDNLAEQILIAVLMLLKSDVADHGKHLQHYFQLFTMYASTGAAQKMQLIKLNVPAIFIKVAIDEGPGPPIKYPNAELGKLHQVVSMLVRCTDVTVKCQSSSDRAVAAVLPNVFADPNFIAPSTAAAAAATEHASDRPYPATPLHKEAAEILYGRTSYTKKLLEDISAGDEGLRLLQFCCWENPNFSRNVLTELLWLCAQTGHHLQDMRHHTELLLHVLLMEDSWQNHRIHNALHGVLDERDGLFTIMERQKKNYPRRAYQIVKLLVLLFKQSHVANGMLHKSQELGRYWTMAVEWLQESLERQRLVGGAGFAYSWSPQGQSGGGGGSSGSYEGGNSGSGGGGSTSASSAYMLERTPSTKNTLRLACELCPDEEQEEPTDSDVEPLDDETSRNVAIAAAVAPIANTIANAAHSSSSGSAAADSAVTAVMAADLSKNAELKVLHQSTSVADDDASLLPQDLSTQQSNHHRSADVGSDRRPVHSRSASGIGVVDLETFKDLDIASKSTDTSSNSSHATVVMQPQQQQQQPASQSHPDISGKQLHTSDGDDETRSSVNSSPPQQQQQATVVTSISQYGIVQPNEALMSCISNEQLTGGSNTNIHSVGTPSKAPQSPSSSAPTTTTTTTTLAKTPTTPTTPTTTTTTTPSVNHPSNANGKLSPARPSIPKAQVP